MGNVGAGASGGALFYPNNHAVGSATLVNFFNGADSAGVCPVSPLGHRESDSIVHCEQ